MAKAEEVSALSDRVGRGLVVVEHAGSPVAIGTVLAQDGRILTSLSGLGGAERLDALYADGSVVHTKLGHGDPGLDLALLIPEGAPSQRHTEGLTASEADAALAAARAVVPAQGTRLGEADAKITGHAEVHSRRGDPLASMLDVEVRGPSVVGAPLLDGTGHVLAILVRACKGRGQGKEGGSAPPAVSPARAEASCVPAVVAVPTSALRSFLSADAPAAALLAEATAPWLGIRGEPDSARGAHGVRIVDVAPASPAQAAGLKAGELILAVDGAPIDQPDTLGAAIGKRAIGDTVKLLVLGEAKFREVAVVLRHSPRATP